MIADDVDSDGPAAGTSVKTWDSSEWEIDDEVAMVQGRVEVLAGGKVSVVGTEALSSKRWERCRATTDPCRSPDCG